MEDKKQIAAVKPAWEVYDAAVKQAREVRDAAEKQPREGNTITRKGSL